MNELNHLQTFNTRWKVLDEIYNIYIVLHRSDLKISATVRSYFVVVTSIPKTI